MNPFPRSRNPFGALRSSLAALLALVALLASGAALADPPQRAARLGYAYGTVSLSPAGDDQWYQAPVNRPLAIGDRLWTDAGALAEIQVGGAVARMGAESSVALLDFDDRIAQFRLTQGTLRLHVRRLEPGQAYEIATPNLAFTVEEPGDYRVDVDASGDSTFVMSGRGQAVVDGEGNAYTIQQGRAYRFFGTGLRQYDEVALPAPDDLDRWAHDRDVRAERAAAANYVSPDVIGYEDLDAYGRWSADPTWGSVWYPTAVSAGWSPYAFGHWTWIAPWGWTWIDDAPWGFAVTHYGRWVHHHDRWGWVPGPARARAVYAPALVVFVGGSHFRAFGNAPAVGWYPLGPREIWRPAYAVSRNYFTVVNVSNAGLPRERVHDAYDRRDRDDERHANRAVPGAVVAVTENAFARSQAVQQVAARLRRDEIARVRATPTLDLAPVRPGIRADARPAVAPPARIVERPVIARNAPPAPVVGVDVPRRTRDAAVDRARARSAPAITGAPAAPSAVEAPRLRLGERPAVRVVGPQTARPAERVVPRDVRGERPAAQAVQPAPQAPQAPQVQRRDAIEPRIERSAPEQRIERSAPEPRIERSAPEPRLERRDPGARIDRSAPVERDASPTLERRPTPRFERPEREVAPRIEAPAPRVIETPRATPAPNVEAPAPIRPPRIEQQPRFEAPQRAPRVEVPAAPRVEVPRPQPRFEPPAAPRVEVPRPQPRFEPPPQPRVEVPRPQPRFEPPPQPRVEVPRPQPRFEPPQPRVEMPRPQPRFEPPPQPRIEAPRIERPQPQQVPRPQPLERPERRMPQQQ